MTISEIVRRVMVALSAVVVLEGLALLIAFRESGGLAVAIVAAFFALAALYVGPRAARDAAEAPGVVYTVTAGLMLLLALLMLDPLAVGLFHHHVATAMTVFVMPIVISVLTGGAAFAVAVSGGRRR
ncbi:hypothetical protein EPN52_15180 [bacterium]|nr:MAG: hypothetical protein EPN52_15180 [bacterium]